ncbi:proline-rich protein HaeIII subfamily 1-like [Molothrus aeneus]|uniref:proline-rich protein HaeIII subfamily 1-like n=1 Tax=Molothrus aeneus TaxID=84833 RepID=UPI00345A1E1B
MKRRRPGGRFLGPAARCSPQGPSVPRPPPAGSTCAGPPLHCTAGIAPHPTAPRRGGDRRVPPRLLPPPHALSRSTPAPPSSPPAPQASPASGAPPAAGPTRAPQGLARPRGARPRLWPPAAVAKALPRIAARPCSPATRSRLPPAPPPPPVATEQRRRRRRRSAPAPRPPLRPRPPAAAPAPVASHAYPGGPLATRPEVPPLDCGDSVPGLAARGATAALRPPLPGLDCAARREGGGGYPAGVGTGDPPHLGDPLMRQGAMCLPPPVCASVQLWFSSPHGCGGGTRRRVPAAPLPPRFPPDKPQVVTDTFPGGCSGTCC